MIYVALCTENGQNRGTPAGQLRGWAFKLKLGLDEEEFGARQHDRPNENRRNADCIFSLRYCSSLCCCVLLAIAAETEACCSCQRVFEAFISKIDTAPGRQCENPFFVLTNAHHTATRTNDSHLQQSLTHHVTSIRGLALCAEKHTRIQRPIDCTQAKIGANHAVAQKAYICITTEGTARIPRTQPTSNENPFTKQNEPDPAKNVSTHTVSPRIYY